MANKRKKMKTKRLINVVAAITLVLSLSFLGASINVLGTPVEETSVVTDNVHEATNGNSDNVYVVQNVHVAPDKMYAPIVGRRDRSGETRPLRGAWWEAYYVDIEIVAGKLAL
jgi:hypothetical protein